MAKFFTGNTGGSTGPHLDFRVWDVGAGSYVDPRGFTDMLMVGGKKLTDQFGVTSGYGMRTHPVKGGQRMHHGIDYGTPLGTEVEVAGGKYIGTTNDATGGGITSQYAFVGPDGKQYEALLMHGSDGNKVTSDSFITDYDFDSLGLTDTTGTTPDGPVLASKSTPKEVEEKLDTYKWAAKAASDVVKGMGNQFENMKSQRLADALAGAQEDIIQAQMSDGKSFGSKLVRMAGEKPELKEI